MGRERRQRGERERESGFYVSVGLWPVTKGSCL